MSENESFADFLERLSSNWGWFLFSTSINIPMSFFLIFEGVLWAGIPCLCGQLFYCFTFFQCRTATRKFEDTREINGRDTIGIDEKITEGINYWERVNKRLDQELEKSGCLTWEGLSSTLDKEELKCST